MVDDVRVVLPLLFVITEFNRQPEGGSVSLTWTSRPDRGYRVVGSTDLIAWNHELGNNLGTGDDEISEDVNQITITFNLTDALLGGEPRLFFRVEEEWKHPPQNT